MLKLVSRLFVAFREIPSLCTPMYYSLQYYYVFDLSECVPGPIYIIDQYCFEGYKFNLKDGIGKTKNNTVTFVQTKVEISLFQYASCVP